MSNCEDRTDPWPGRIAASVAGVCAAHTWLVVALVLLITSASAFHAVMNLRVNTDNLDMISAETPFRRANLEFREAFPWYGDQMVVVIDAAVPELAELAAADLVERMSIRPDLFQHIQAPGIDPYLRRNGLMFMKIERLQDLLDRLASAQGLLAVLAEKPDLTGVLEMLSLAVDQTDPGGVESRQLLLLTRKLTEMAVNGPHAEPVLSWRRELAVEGQRGLEGRQIVIAKPVQNYGSLSPAKAAMAELREIFRDGIDGVTYRITGNAALNTEELQSVKLGGSTAGIISGIGILLLLIVGLRGPRPVLATLMVLICGLVISLGFATVAVGQLNLLSVAFAVLFIGLAVDFSIHFALRMQELGGGRAAAAEAARSVGPSIALSAVAAAIGFLSFLPTDYRGLAELGVIAGGSMAVALILNLTLLPALLGAGGPRTVDLAPRSARQPFIIAPGLTAAIAVGGMAAAVAIFFFVSFDSDPINLKDPNAESVATYLDLSDDETRGVYAVDGLVPANVDLDELEARLEVASRNGRVLHINQFVPTGQEAKLAALDAASLFLFPVLTAEAQSTPTAPVRREAVAGFAKSVEAAKGEPGLAANRLATVLAALSDDELEALEQRATRTLLLWLDDMRAAFTAEPVTPETIPEEFRAHWIAPDGRLRVQVFPGRAFVDYWTMSDYARDIQAVMPSATGAPVMVTFAGEAVVGSFIEASAIAAVLVLLLLMVLLRRVGDVVLTAAPVALAAVLTFVLMPLFGLQLNFANVIVLPLLFGLGVASAIHIVMRRRSSGDAANMMRSSTPRAVLFSTLTTLASFGGLALSPHLGMASMGLLLTIAILSVLLFALIWLPGVLQGLDQRLAKKDSASK
jgi:hopanoid biosynthesis associated RND transporter like protein HpnN